MNIQDEKFVRFQHWTSDRSFSSEPILSGEKSTDDSKMNVIQRGLQRGLGAIKTLYHDPTLKNIPGDELDSNKKILDPQGHFLQKWNKIFVLLCFLAVSLDPLFFYTPVINDLDTTLCLDLDRKLAITASVLRSVTDMFYVLHIIFQFQTGYIAPPSRVFGRGVLVEDVSSIASRYLKSYFLIDLAAVLPLPQIVVLAKVREGMASQNTKDLLLYIVMLQYVPRFARIFPLYQEVTRSSGIITETASAGAIFNLLLYMLASHIFGALWYMLSVERGFSCWRNKACKNSTNCHRYLYCGSGIGANKSFLADSCPITQADPAIYDFGIYLSALQNVAQTRHFLEKFFYCFWWGLQNLSSLAQGLKTSTYVGENLFAAFIAISGLVLFALLIGNMQTFLQSTTRRIEEMRVKRRDAEQWMSHRLLPENLRERIRRHEQYRWQETRGVDEGNLLCNLPKDLRRDIKRHLCLSLLMRVPMFEKMDDQLIDALCDRLLPVLYTKGSCIVREGDPVNEMLFIMRGKLDSVTTNGGRTGFFNSDTLKAGDFCGEELLTWALDPRLSSHLPISTRTVKALAEVEAFALVAEDLRFVASQFRRLHSKQLRHTFRFYSQQWRTWAACFIQAAWRRYSRRKLEESLHEEENKLQSVLEKAGGSSPSLGATIYASRFAVNALRALRRNGGRKARVPERLPVMLLQKPSEPDFNAEE